MALIKILKNVVKTIKIHFSKKTYLLCFKARCCKAYITKLCLLSYQAFRRIKINSEKGSQMLLCSRLCLSLESSFPLPHMSKNYLHFKMQLKCHFFPKSFPDIPWPPGRGNPDKLRTLIRKKIMFYLSLHPQPLALTQNRCPVNTDWVDLLPLDNLQNTLFPITLTTFTTSFFLNWVFTVFRLSY